MCIRDRYQRRVHGGTHSRFSMRVNIAHALLFLSSILMAHAAVTPAEIEDVLQLNHKYVFNTQIDGAYWHYGPYLGTMFISQHFLVMNWLGLHQYSAINTTRLRAMLHEQQFTDGGWKQVPDPNRNFSDIDASVFNYWALKVLNEPLDGDVMTRARKWILSRGGIEAATHMTKIWLCLFGNYDWEKIPHLPLFAFRNDSLYSFSFAKNFVAQWVWPHIIPIAYLRHHMKQKDLGANYHLGELYTEPTIIPKHIVERDDIPEYSVKNLIEKIYNIRQPRGTFGTYTVSSMYSLMALQDYEENWPHQVNKDLHRQIFNQTFEFIEDLYYRQGNSSYIGVLMDGRYWDTLLVSWGLVESGAAPESLYPTVEHLIKYAIQPCGGIPYALDFEYAPDTDDTGVMVVFLSWLKDKYPHLIEKANEWLVSMQNDDGGYGAFDRNKGEFWVVKWIAGSFSNSAEIFDQSSVDVTAHVLEGWGKTGHTLKDRHVQEAIRYIRNEQLDFGSWEGRWGVNYIYAAGSVLPALASVGYNLREEWVMKSINWLLPLQNTDGGFGESTLSYRFKEFIGRGISTPTQTAWALLALLEAEKFGINVGDSTDRAAEYLVREFHRFGRWFDESSVGTGHRGILFMQYPSYANAFPMVALGRYLKYKQQIGTANAQSVSCVSFDIWIIVCAFLFVRRLV
eukprot:TRINITY_DN6722_c0_g2_i6.p1 TRINITY_DN6722_c0_g2~~TRINITY_DN6722_c0_g2_i6.p1  ORF type:complete len:680 (+),score=203.09 TRINITY_DN6722_c0_g2_i6:64-2103(+)